MLLRTGVARHCEPHPMGPVPPEGNAGNPAFLLDYLLDCFAAIAMTWKTFGRCSIRRCRYGDLPHRGFLHRGLPYRDRLLSRHRFLLFACLDRIRDEFDQLGSINRLGRVIVAASRDALFAIA